MTAKRQNIQLELALEPRGEGEARSPGGQGTEVVAAAFVLESPAVFGPTMEVVVSGDNLRRALKQVQRNKGAPGLDGMTVEGFASHLRENWPDIRDQLLQGTYKPQPVLRVKIPKATGGTRALGIPMVLDRFIQQAVMQILQADWDPTFSKASYGFRPGRSAHQAISKAQAYATEGHHWVVDIDLEKFFDRVNHDMLMGLVAKRVSDHRLLKLIRGFLTAGVLADGLVSPTGEGTPRVAHCRLCYRT